MSFPAEKPDSTATGEVCAPACACSSQPQTKAGLDDQKLQKRLFLLLFLLVVAVFHPVLRGELLPWDDDIHITGNPHLNGVGLDRLYAMFTETGHVGRYEPLCWVTWAAVKECFGLSPLFFHLIVLLFHALNSGLVFLLIRKLLGLARPATVPGHLTLCAALGAALWAIHPLRVESTAWAVELAYVQPLFLFLLSLLCYLRAAEGVNTARFYWASVGLFALSLLSFPLALGGGVALVALDLFPLRRLSWNPAQWLTPPQRRVWLMKLPFLAVTLFIGGLTLHVARSYAALSGNGSLQELGLLERAMRAFFIWAHYLWRPWLPLDLTPVPTQLLELNPLGMAPLLSAAGVIGLTAFLFWRRTRWPGIFATWIAYLALLIPMLGLSERHHYPTDRYSLVASIGWSILLAGTFVRFWPQLQARRVLLAALAVLLPTLGVMSYRQCFVWQTSTGFFRHILASWKDDPKLARPRLTINLRLAQAHMDHGEFASAAEVLRQVIRDNPDFPGGHQQLGRCLTLAGDLEGARASYKEAARLNPSLLPLLNDVGVAYARAGNLDAAMVQFAEVLRERPHQESALHNMARALLAQNRTNEANVYLERLKNLPSQPVAIR